MVSMNIWEQEIERLTARVKELEEALAYDAMMADQLCSALERREARIKELEAARDQLIHNSAEKARNLGLEKYDVETQLHTAIRERDQARKALEPFAKAMLFWDSHFPEASDDALCDAGDCTVGDLRRARSSSNREGGE